MFPSGVQTAVGITVSVGTARQPIGGTTLTNWPTGQGVLVALGVGVIVGVGVGVVVPVGNAA